jgi:hypothetical protein
MKKLDRIEKALKDTLAPAKASEMMSLIREELAEQAPSPAKVPGDVMRISVIAKEIGCHPDTIQAFLRKRPDVRRWKTGPKGWISASKEELLTAMLVESPVSEE